MRAQTIGSQQSQRHQDPALELRDLEDVLEALEPFHHFAGPPDLALGPSPLATSTSTRPPAASSFCFADSLIRCALTVSACATAPSPSTLTAWRPALLIRRASTSPSGSTALPAAKRAERSVTLTTANWVLPPYGRKPRLGRRRYNGI